MRSRLMEELSQQIRSTRDRRAWAKLVCRQASHYARQGYANEAAGAIAAVRKEFGNDLDADVAAWLILAEGILHFFLDDWDQAFDRIRRAHTIATALQAATARPSCSAWLAFIEFNQCDFEGTATHLREALSTASAEDHQARARACLLAADAYHYAGSFSSARPWYEKARLHATAEGDEATLSALLFNMAATRSANVRLADAFGDRMPEEAKQASMEARSVLNYDAAIGTKSLSSLVPIVRSQLLAVDREFAAALDILQQVKQDSISHRLQTLVLTETAWCQANLNQPAASIAGLNAVSQRDLDDQDSDDLAYVHSRIAQAASLLGLRELEDTHSPLAVNALRAHQRVQSALRASLDLKIGEYKST